MEKERSKLELWLIVEENFNNLFDKGLCSVLTRLWIEKRLINEKEYHKLKKILHDYGINRFDILSLKNIETRYWWEKRAAKPRRMFIQKQILKEIRKSN